ncbi:hypothetical protein [Streptomyces sp. STR69]|uniref:hypothetical protein n=1 Tax=Streptomyces sp. STR69 TaxID=1796942 RepID=UPI0021CA7CEA|nr:hypothetical protein [Streptomyces sp. STR69]
MATRPVPEHGSRARYARGCRCAACRDANRSYENNRARRTAYGTWQPYVGAEPVRRHVRALMDQGMGWRRIAEASGVSKGTVNKLLYGAPGRGVAPCRRIRRETAEQLLAVRYSAELLAAGALVDATGTWRRIRALVAVGWPKAHIAQALGAAAPALQLNELLVVASTARRVASLYDEWWDADPAAHGVDPHQAERARRHAVSQSWPPPMAWDDGDLDDPEAVPHVEGQVRNLRTRSAEHLNDARHLLSCGVPLHEVAARVGLTPGYIRTRLAIPVQDRAASA